jgi:hypothetical protein
LTSLFPEWWLEEDRQESKQLNRWYKVWYRRIDQWLRRRFVRGEKRRQLLEEKRYILNFDRSHTDLGRLQQINWELGTGCVYKHTEKGKELGRWLVTKMRSEEMKRSKNRECQ